MATFTLDAAIEPTYIDYIDIAAGYGILSVPVDGLLSGDLVETLTLVATLAQSGTEVFSKAIDQSQRTDGYFEWVTQSEIDGHFTILAADITALNAATEDVQYSVSAIVTRSDNTYTREVQGGGMAARPLVPTPPMLVNSIAITDGPASGGPGDTQILTAVTYDGYGNVITGQLIVWASTNPDIADVDQSGTVSFITPGIVTISATCQGLTATTTATTSTGMVPANDGDILVYDSVDGWVAVQPTVDHFLPGTFGGTSSDTYAFPGPVSFRGRSYTWPAAYVAGSFLQTDGSGNLSWALPIEDITLAQLSDVTISSVATGQFLQKSSGNWVNHTLVSADVTDAASANTVSVIVKRDGSGNFSAGTITANLSGNATTASSVAVLTTPRTISITGDITYTSAAFDGSANVTGTGTLATVNGNVGTFGSSAAIPVITVNAKGLITAVSTAAVSSAASGLTGTTLAANVVNSSLTTFGVMASPHMTSPVVDSGGLTITSGTLAAQAITGTTLVLSGSLTGTSATFSTTLGVTGVASLLNDLNIIGPLGAGTLPPDQSTNGHLIRSSTGNAATFQSTNAAAFSAIRFVTAAGVEKTAIGTGAGSTSSPYDVPFWETLNSTNGDLSLTARRILGTYRPVSTNAAATLVEFSTDGTAFWNYFNPVASTSLQVLKINPTGLLTQDTFTNRDTGTAYNTFTTSIAGTTVNRNDLTILDLAGTGGRINFFDANCAIYGRQGATNTLNFYSFGGTGATKGHKFYTGGVFGSQVLRASIADDGAYFTVPITVTTGTTSLQALTGTTGNFSSTMTASSYTGALIKTLTFGTYLTGTSFNNSADVTLATNAVSTNTASTIVARDGSGNFSAGTITATLTGSISGNAATATALQNARTINGTSFDGTANITVTAAAGTLTGTTLNATVVATSITSVGVLASPHITTLTVDSGGITVTSGTTAVQALTATTITASGILTMSAAVSEIVPGATSFAIRNNAANQNNFIVTNAGNATVLGTFGAAQTTIGGGSQGSSTGLFVVNQTGSTTNDIVVQLTHTAVTGSVTAVDARAAVTGDWSVYVQNSGAGRARFYALVVGAGDPLTQYEVNGAAAWTTGLDQSDSSAFVIAASNALGTSNALKITTAGAVTIPGTLGVTGNSTFAGTLSGITTLTATTVVAALTGNASTATALATARAINGTNFDGTAAITLTAAAGTLTGATLASNVLATSITSVGILASPHFTAPVVDSGGLTMSAAASKIIPGVTSWSVRNNADGADNLIITDAGAATFRSTLTVTAGGLTVSSGTSALQALTATTGVFSSTLQAGGTLTVTTGGASITSAANTVNTTHVGGGLTGSNTSSTLSITETWNTSGAPVGILYAVTNTASSASSLLMDLRSGSGGATSRFSVTVAGNVTTGGSLSVGTSIGVGTGITVGTTVTVATAGSFLVSGRGGWSASADGTFLFTNSAANGITRLMLGLTTTSGSAIAVSGTTVSFTLGDGTGNATVNTGTLGVTGTVTASGDLVLSTIGKTISIKGGSNAKIGTGTLVAGAATISTTAVTANSRIFLTDTGGGVNIGAIYVSTITAGTSFVVTSLNVLDTSSFNWWIVEQG